MNVSVSPSKNGTAVHININGHDYTVGRRDIPPNLDPMVKLAADTYWKSEASGDVSYSVILYPEV